MEKVRKKAINMLKLWIACVIMYSIGSSIYISYQQVIFGNDLTVFVSRYHLTTLGVLVLFFLPLLAVVRYLAIKTNMEKLLMVVKAIFVWFSLFLGLFVLCIVLAYTAPEMFLKITSLYG